MSYTPKDAAQIRIGNYTLLQTLGSGSFAKVKRNISHTFTTSRCSYTNPAQSGPQNTLPGKDSARRND